MPLVLDFFAVFLFKLLLSDGVMCCIRGFVPPTLLVLLCITPLEFVGRLRAGEKGGRSTESVDSLLFVLLCANALESIGCLCAGENEGIVISRVSPFVGLQIALLLESIEFVCLGEEASRVESEILHALVALSIRPCDECAV